MVGNTFPIEVKGLCKAFDDNVILDGINLRLLEGEIFYVVGPSGTGKSVLTRCCMGLMPADAGEVFFYGEPTPPFGSKRWIALRRQVAMVVQFPALLEERSVAENIAVAARYGAGLTCHQADLRAAEVLERLRLSALAKTMPGALGPGRAKAVALARALAVGAKTLILDEPTTGLDPIQANLVDRAIVEVVRVTGVSCLVISHDLDGMQKVADRAVMLYRGRALVQGAPEELRRNPDPVWQQFLNGRAEGPL